MIGSKAMMPKRLRYPLFLLGLAVILIGGMVLNSQGAGATTLAADALAGLALIVSSVILR